MDNYNNNDDITFIHDNWYNTNNNNNNNNNNPPATHTVYCGFGPKPIYDIACFIACFQ